ncbi:hypothetical protein CYR55_22825 [Chimaeribacter californicus]|uniref:Uncharacterized protein n=1 Tax=Chimaeribacter californicus TaxID=2060067 RepID=A0A2N5DSW1_9GAMM|nr:hypothetical protein [Chimaeribacter californicus]PLR29340.1 hypothetical protein CYR55_22825 [Chimaeribacter californicus]
MSRLFSIFHRKHFFWSVSFVTDNGARSVIVHYPDKLMTPLRLGMLLNQEGASNATVLSADFLGRMSLHTASTKF